MRYFFLLILSCLICPSFGQNINTGTIYTGLANSCISLKSPYQVFHNQAGLSDVKSNNVGFTYADRFQQEEFSSKSVFAVIPIYNTVYAIDYTHYGSHEYFEEATGLSVSRCLSRNISLGLKFKYAHSFVERYSRNRTEYNIECGIQYKFLDDFSYGIHISNPISKYNYISSKSFRTGFSWSIYNNLLITTEYTYIENLSRFFAVGLEWHCYKDLYINIGKYSIDKSPRMGVGYRYKSFNSYVSIYSHDQLGYSSSISINYEI